MLRQRATLVDDLAYTIGDVQKAFEPMLELMRDTQGVGLAAPQVGISRQFFLMDLNSKVSVYVNPIIIEKSTEKVESIEGCLSLPAKPTYQLTRAESITISAEDYYGVEKEYTFSGYGAIIVQHELDHLQGRLINDYWEAYH